MKAVSILWWKGHLVREGLSETFKHEHHHMKVKLER